MARALFALCALLALWSLLAWWGAAFSPLDHYKFGALGAARVGEVQERCSWFFGGEYEEHCRPRAGGELRLTILRFGAPLLLVCLFAAVIGMFVPLRWLAIDAALAAALAIAAIACNAEAALAFAAARELSIAGTGFVAAVLAVATAAAAAAVTRHRTMAVS